MTITTLPWLETGKSFIGLKEIPGKTHNSTIISWANQLGAAVLGIAVKDDETPWCGTFAAKCVVSAGLTPPKIAVRASSWATWGLPCNNPAVGAIAVFKRPGGGHVGIIVDWDDKYLYILGGNQSNGVNVSKIERTRCVAMRWPFGVPLTKVSSGLTNGHVPVSTTEA